MDLAELQKRVEQLERQNRRMKYAALLLLVVLGSIAGVGAAGLSGKTINAEKIILTDPKFGHRTEVTAYGINVFDKKGRTVSALNEYGLCLMTKPQDPTEKLETAISIMGGSSPAVVIFHPHARQPITLGGIRTTMGVRAASLGCSSLYDPRTEAETSLPPSSLVLFSKEGKVKFRAP